ncbi:MAG: homoserine O-succinyltransferase [Gammaproteobacteria bacterium]|nr:homoserine O-succinyltransferase [Gammaproteobacteria bacterium]
MTLVAHSDLPTFAHLRDHGHELLSLERAKHQDIRELHIGFLNMMPDAALQATERQFIRLVGSCNRIAQFFVYPFSLPSLTRSAETGDYIEKYYSRFEDLREQGLDALVITGANVANPHLDQEPFWEPLLDVVRWADENVASTLCSCLATHALLKYSHGIERQPLPNKRWGVYSHRVCAPDHPLNRDVNTRYDVPHSRYNDISRAQLEAAGLRVLAESAEGGVHLAVSPDQVRVVYFQGHPEYDHNSLLKEFRREVRRFAAGERETFPLYPENFFPEEARCLIESVRNDPDALIDLLGNEIEQHLDNTWGDTAKAIVNNWLGIVYQLTNLERTEQFMPGIDPDDPLNLRT